MLFVFVVLAHERRRILHVNVPPHPTSAWIRQQLREAFPNETNARFILHDRDTTFDTAFGREVEAFGLTAVRTAPRSPWQNPYVERVIGSIRRECLDHVIVLNERHLRRVLRTYVAYYQQSRTHLALGKDAPVERAVQPTGRIVVRPEVGGLHHRYGRPPDRAWFHEACDRRWAWRSACELVRRHLERRNPPPTLPWPSSDGRTVAFVGELITLEGRANACREVMAKDTCSQRTDILDPTG
jgi:hypothetical protein